MNDKSYVTMEQAVCPVCGQTHDTGALLLDTRLRPMFGHSTVTHYEMCHEHAKLRDEGYIALVECSNKPDGETLKPEDAIGTGNVAHVRRTAFEHIFNCPVPTAAIAFVEAGVIDKLRQLMPSLEGEAP